MKQSDKSSYVCPCFECSEHPNAEGARLHASINHVVASLNEKNRRRFAGLLASQLGHGGTQYIAMVTGISRPTIWRGRREIERVNHVTPHGGVRTAGGGRKRAEKKRRRS